MVFLRLLPNAGGYPPAFFALPEAMRFLVTQLNIYVDESGEQEGFSKYYLLTLVFLDNALDISQQIKAYERALTEKDLPNISFHASPLMNGNDDYSNLTPETRKRLLNAFNVFSQNLPLTYVTFCYKRREVSTTGSLQGVMSRDLTSFFMNNLEFFQKFDKVCVHYDAGQEVVSKALQSMAESVFASGVVEFCYLRFKDSRMLQVADFYCAIELANVKFEHHEETSTDLKIYGYVGTFKNNYLKQAKRKRILHNL